MPRVAEYMPERAEGKPVDKFIFTWVASSHGICPDREREYAPIRQFSPTCILFHFAVAFSDAKSFACGSTNVAAHMLLEKVEF
jgi:hypothetical protein